MKKARQVMVGVVMLLAGLAGLVGAIWGGSYVGHVAHDTWISVPAAATAWIVGVLAVVLGIIGAIVLADGCGVMP